MTDQLIHRICRSLSIHAKDAFDGPPVLVTFTTVLPQDINSQNLLLNLWKRFRVTMSRSAEYRTVQFPIAAWAVELSKNSLHVHAACGGYVNQKALQKAWKHTSVSFGNVDVREFDTWMNLFTYVLKKFARLSKFFGLSVVLRTKSLYNLQT